MMTDERYKELMNLLADYIQKQDKETIEKELKLKGSMLFLARFAIEHGVTAREMQDLYSGMSANIQAARFREYMEDPNF
jgi:hypothetical protein